MPKCEISVVLDGGTTPLTDTWVYMAEGDDLSTWRAGPDGKLMKLRAGADATAATRSWRYDEKLTLEVPKTAHFYSSRGARPLSEKILKEKVFSNAHAWVERTIELPAEATHDVAPGDTAVIALRTAVIALPRIEVALTTPEELSILPVLWDHAPHDDADADKDYLRAGFDQKAEDPHEGTAAAAAPADVQPRERGVILKGTIDARARNVLIALLDPSGNPISVRPLTATASPADHAVVATSAASGHRGFEVHLWFEKPTKAFGAVQVLIESADEDEAVHIVGVFSIVLVGMQIALVDDTAANENGKEPGPVVGQAGELIIHDFTESPVREPVSSDLFLKAFASTEHAKEGARDKAAHLKEVTDLFAEGKKELAKAHAAMVKTVAATRLPVVKTDLLATKTALAAAKGKLPNAGSATPAITSALVSRVLDAIGDEDFDAEAPELASALQAVDDLLEPAASNATAALTKALADAGDALDNALTELEHESAATVDAARNEAKAKRLLAEAAAKASLDAAEAARAAGGAAADSAHTAVDTGVVKDVLKAIEVERARLRAVAAQKANAALFEKGRVRRMARYPIRATRERKLDDTGPKILHPEMPMWMAELQLFGLDKPTVEDLLAHRKRLIAGNPISITLSVDWQLRFRWKGPDMSSGGRALDDNVRGIWTATGLQKIAQEVVLAIDGEDALAVDGDAVKNAFKTPPVALPYPVADRRKPVVAIANRARPWGRAAAAATLNAMVVEWQVPIVNGAGKEKIRGGDGELSIVTLDVGERAIALGISAITAPAHDPVIKLVPFRMLGKNTVLWPAGRGIRVPPPGSADALSRAVDAVIENHYGKLDPATAARAVDLAGWKIMMRSIIWWESGYEGKHFSTTTWAQFVHDPDRNKAWSYGQQVGTPIFGFPHGYTLVQTDPTASDDAMWSFLEAICGGLDVAFDKARAAREMLRTQGFDPGNRRHREVLLRDSVRRYNCNKAEFVWGHPHGHEAPPDGTPDPKDWVIFRKRGSTNLTYPNDVLGTSVNYKKSMPIEFTSDMYVLPAPEAPAPPAAAAPPATPPAAPPAAAPPATPPAAPPAATH